MKTTISALIAVLAISLVSAGHAQNGNAVPGDAGLDPAAGTNAAEKAAKAKAALNAAAAEMDPAVLAYNSLLAQIDSDAAQYDTFYVKQKKLDDQVAELNQQGRRDDAIRIAQARDSARASAKMWLGLIVAPAAEATRIYAEFKQTPIFSQIYRPTGYTRARTLLRGHAGVDPDLQYLDHTDTSVDSLQHQIADVQDQIARATAKKDEQIAQLQDDARRNDKLVADLRSQLEEAEMSRTLLKDQLTGGLTHAPAPSKSAAVAPLAALVERYNSLLHQIETDQAAELTPHVTDDVPKAAQMYAVASGNPLFAAAFREGAAAHIVGADPELHYITHR